MSGRLRACRNSRSDGEVLSLRYLRYPDAANQPQSPTNTHPPRLGLPVFVNGLTTCAEDVHLLCYPVPKQPGRRECENDYGNPLSATRMDQG
jgi:hypothetical protein